ncbi:MAG: NAD-dependent epimerase/dehydratase family protein [Cytophagales bacterium]|nr:NAD-dependent epimerase/dehydratase family protein [Cytophagales bacterium]
MDRTALVVGATGLVGKALIRLLLTKNYYKKIIVFSRRELEIKDNRIEMVILDDFDKMEEVADQINAHDVYCALGTTLKQAGSKEQFLKIDVEWPVRLAKIVKEQPLFKQFLMVTSHGADSESPLFYNQVKGEVEDELVKLKLDALKIFQPSLLLGYRDEFRWKEEIAKFFSAVLSFFMVGTKTTLWTIRGTEVAAAMYAIAIRRDSGLRKINVRKMTQLALK